MKNLSLKICLVAALSLILIACSNVDSSPPSSSPTIVTLKNSTNQSRVSDFNSPSHTNTYAQSVIALSRSSSLGISYSSSTISAPSLPTAAVNLEGTYAWTVSPNTDYYLLDGASYSEQLYLGNGINYYISGDLTITSYYGTGGSNIYILDGGSITLSGEFNNNTISLWGDAIFTSDFELGANGAFYYYGSNTLSTDYDLILRGTFSSDSSVSAQNIVVSNSSGSDSQTIVFGSCVSVENEFYTENNANVYINSSLKATTITNDSYAKIYLSAGSLVQATTIYFENDSRFINQSSDGYAVIVATHFEIDNNTYAQRISGGEVRVDYSTISDDNSGNAVQWAASVNFINSIDSNTYIPTNDCGHSYGEGSSQEEELTLEHVTKIESPDIERISATSIDFSGNYLYVSWHEREDNYQGYIDAVRVSDLTIEATYYTSELDFNHIYLASGANQIYVTGGKKSGAFYSAVTHNAAAKTVSITINKLQGSSGNCIVEDTDYNWVVSGANGGITAVNAQDSIYTYLPESKFITRFNNDMVVLAGVDTNDAKLHRFDPTTGLEASEAEVTIGHIPVVDGKNTLFVYDNYLYACLGEGGLKVIDSSYNVVGSFYNSNGQGSVNCVYVDDKYIYVANGVAGLYILDKTSLTVLKTYQLGDTSANYIKVQDSLIYVAYGLDGVHVFKLIES